MAIALVGSSSTADGVPTGTGWSVAVPTHSADDLLLAVISSNLDGSATMSIQESGWTQVTYLNSYTANSLLVLYKKAASGSETVTIDQSAANEKIACVAAFSGVDTTTAIDTAWASSAAASTTHSHAGVTADTGGWAIGIFGHDDGSDNGQNGPNNGTASGWTVIQEHGQGGTGGTFSDPSSGGAGFGIAYKAVGASTASGNHEWSLGGSETGYAGTLILKEGAASGSIIPQAFHHYRNNSGSGL